MTGERDNSLPGRMASGDGAGGAPFPVERSKTTPHGFRLDIQALRGWAIILVVWHHARGPGLPGGFLGVDIFFVISGYLMTGIIARELDEARFSLRGFYERRVRRLLPAAYATLAVTALLAPFLLDAFEYRNFVNQLIGTATFTANFVLWRQADYFNSGAALKPLLHTWSLSVEEQYYLVLPLLLMLFPRRWRFEFVALLTLGSAILCLAMLGRNPSATFYMLPTRAWELGIGSMAAVAVRRDWVVPRAMPATRLLAVAALVVVPMMFDERGHPGLPALVVCLATGILILPGLDLRSSWLWRPATWAGDRSYSLYLVHWPVFAFANNLFLGPQPAWLGLALLLPCLVWMEAQYRLVEQPLRTWQVGGRQVALLVLVPALLIAGSFVWLRLGVPTVDPRDSEAHGLSRGCDYKGDYQALPQCRSGDAPRILLWGDSFAMHLGAGLQASTPDGIVQATRTVCGPFIGIAPIDGELRTRAWAERCMAFNDQVAVALAGMETVDTVVLSTPLEQYLPGGETDWRTLRRDTDGTLAEEPATREALIAGLAATAAQVRALGKRVVLVAPPPATGIDLARCVRRQSGGLATISSQAGCEFTTAQAAAYRRHVRSLLAEIERRGIVPVYRLDPGLCPGGRCMVERGGVPFYRDAGHLSRAGSLWLAQRMRWGETMAAAAR